MQQGFDPKAMNHIYTAADRATQAARHVATLSPLEQQLMRHYEDAIAARDEAEKMKAGVDDAL